MRTAHRARTMVISLILMVIMSLKLLSSPSSVQGISLAMDMTQRPRLVRNSTMVDVKVIIEMPSQMDVAPWDGMDGMVSGWGEV